MGDIFTCQSLIAKINVRNVCEVLYTVIWSECCGTSCFKVIQSFSVKLLALIGRIWKSNLKESD